MPEAEIITVAVIRAKKPTAPVPGTNPLSANPSPRQQRRPLSGVEQASGPSDRSPPREPAANVHCRAGALVLAGLQLHDAKNWRFLVPSAVPVLPCQYC